jgi:hypothetical protein
MLLEGEVINGAIVLDPPATLPEGTKVRVEVMSSLQAAAEWVERARREPETGPTLAERMARSMGVGVDLPADLAERHDHYIHGSGR